MNEQRGDKPEDVATPQLIPAVANVAAQAATSAVPPLQPRLPPFSFCGGIDPPYLRPDASSLSWEDDAPQAGAEGR